LSEFSLCGCAKIACTVCPDLPHICREKRKHEINTQNLPMKKRKIDFSTRNLQAEILSQHTPWVGTLTKVHKKIISDKKCIDLDIINQVHKLSKMYVSFVSVCTDVSQ
jgi:hypothetical protein